MRVLITGASGFAGSYIAAQLVRFGHTVVGLFRHDTPFSKHASAAGAQLIRASLAETPSIPGPFDAVVHTAATSPAPGVSVAQIINDNVVGTEALANSAERWGARALIFFSSISLFGKVNGPVLDECSPILDPDAYGASKQLCELMLSEGADRLPGLALRLPGVLGPGAHRHWLSGVASKLNAGETISVFNPGAPFNNAAHLADIATLVVSVLRREVQGFDSIVLGARGSLSVQQVIERLARGLNVAPRIRVVSSTRPSFTLSSTRAISKWGYDPMEIGAMIDRYASDIFEFGS